MAYPVTGSPTEAFADGLLAILGADATLASLVAGVFTHLPENVRTAYPYVVIGRSVRDNDGGAMQVPGGQVTQQIDVWSDAKSPHPVRAILSRIAVLLERQPVTVTGYLLMGGSVTCVFEDVFDEPDEDKPGSSLYHGVQRWTAQIHGA